MAFITEKLYQTRRARKIEIYKCSDFFATPGNVSTKKYKIRIMLKDEEIIHIPQKLPGVI